MNRGFSLIEVMVAVAISTVLFGLCVSAYVQVNRFKRRSEQLLLLGETARGVFARLGRDLDGLHVADSDADGDTDLVDYWQFEAGAMGTAGDRLTFLSATENAGKLDYCTVRWYVENGRLYREVSGSMGGEPPSGGWPAKAESVLSDGVGKLVVSTVPAAPPGGGVPREVTVTLQMTDPGWKPGFRVYTATLRPGSEER